MIKLRFIIGVIGLIILMFAILAGCKTRHISSITTDSTTSISTKQIDTNLTIKGTSVEKDVNKSFEDSMRINKIYTFFDSLSRVQLQIYKDSLGIVHTKCVENTFTQKFTYPEKTYHTHTKEVHHDTKIKEVTKHDLPWWVKIILVAQTVVIVILALKK